MKYLSTLILVLFASINFVAQNELIISKENQQVETNLLENDLAYFNSQNNPTNPYKFESTIKQCNKCICIRVYSPTKQFQDKAKALFFSHRCPDPCKSCYEARGKTSIEWKEHYQRIYPEADNVSIERSSDEYTVNKCGCNPM
jgi:hypothetical protein